MTKNKQKLELTWIGKGQEMNLEPRILVENPEKSYGAPNTENMLIHGDNLLALKALEQNYTGKIKCIYIDPPYNTGSAFEHYDDNVEHSKWLSLMKVRLEILHNLLAEDGSIWVSLDDNEQAYCKILMDEIFGRNNFINNVIWQKKYSPQNDAKWLSDNHDFIMVYAKNKDLWRPNLLPRTAEMNARYKNPDNDPRGVWKAGDISVKRITPKDIYEIKTPSGRIVLPPAGTSWRYSKEKFNEMVKDNRIWFGPNGDSVPAIKRFLSEVKQGITSLTIWLHTDVGHNDEAKKEVKAFNSEDVFATPKPERLIERVLTLGSNEGDLVLDSFLGSGTTAAVAHKMDRKWIGIELGDHCYTHCEPRLQKVVDGTDQGGISKAVNWQGGGGYKFYELAPSLLKKDEFGNWIIDSRYDAEMLAEAMAKQEGYRFSPDEENIYKQGYSTEKDFIFTTTQFLSIELLDKIYSKLTNDESLLICATHFEEGTGGRYDNITVKKIPQMLLNRCEFGKLEYNLNIIDPPQETEDDEETLEDE
ncbi:TPA: site-specific DNA-methyltransferase [Candidatus Avigastranaerophilus faecigallinarum]|nr:site-specific DNA-methyltransferase [Candidatus Avigastranaerophilus faecigallinarum]